MLRNLNLNSFFDSKMDFLSVETSGLASSKQEEEIDSLTSAASVCSSAGSSGLQVAPIPCKDCTVSEEKLKRARGTPEHPVSTLMTLHCCNRREVTCFKLLTQNKIEHIRSTIYSVSETKQTQIVLDYMLQHSQGDGHVLYTVGGQTVCEACFRMVYGFRFNRFASIKAKFHSGVVVAEHGRLGRGKASNENIRIVSWLRTFIDKVGDKMPTSSDIHLPSCLIKADVFSLALDDLTQGGLKCCKQSTLYEIWLKNFPNVKIPKEGRFSKCDLCTAIKEARERTLNPSVRKWLTEILEKHINLEKAEREKYAKHRHKSEKYPGKYLSIIIDGMDQNKTDIPHIITNPKALAGSYRLETHITGVRAHGRCTLMLIDCGDFPHNTNLTIEALLQVFCHLKDNLPPVLYIQMDNTCRDNKNKYTLTFAALLVELGIFRKVKLGFLPVGHTHEDIDQLFSCVSRRLKHRNAITIPELAQAIKSSFAPEPKVVVLESVADVKAWMREQTPPMHDHLKAHQFKFVRTKSEAKMFYKEWSTDDYWLPQSGLAILPSDNSVPLLQPLVIMPRHDPENLVKLEATLRKLSAYLDKAGAGTWWSSWLTVAKEHTGPMESQEMQGNWVLFELKSKVNQSDEQHSTSSRSSSGLKILTPSQGIRTSQQKSCLIDGIGELQTSWIGQTGVREIGQVVAEEGLQSQVSVLKKELNLLATECSKAFIAAGVEQSQHPQIKKALDLCSTYTCPTYKNVQKDVTSSSIGELWKRDGNIEDIALSEDKTTLAESILGTSLVNTLAERGHEPPDIYIGPSRSTVLHNRDVAKELEVGTLIATAGINFPKVGKVINIPPNRSLDSSISVQWMTQERAPHKPRWQRCFKFGPKDLVGSIKISDVLLYGFQLTSKGCFKKKSRDYLQSLPT